MFAPFAATRTRLFRVAGKDAGNSGVTFRRCLRGEGEGERGKWERQWRIGEVWIRDKG